VVRRLDRPANQEAGRLTEFTHPSRYTLVVNVRRRGELRLGAGSMRHPYLQPRISAASAGPCCLNGLHGMEPLWTLGRSLHGEELVRLENDHAPQLACQLAGPEVALEHTMLRSVEQPTPFP
jgi:hypothetical protein